MIVMMMMMIIVCCLPYTTLPSHWTQSTEHHLAPLWRFCDSGAICRCSDWLTYLKLTVENIDKSMKNLLSPSFNALPIPPRILQVGLRDINSVCCRKKSMKEDCLSIGGRPATSRIYTCALSLDGLYGMGNLKSAHPAGQLWISNLKSTRVSVGR